MRVGKHGDKSPRLKNKKGKIQTHDEKCLRLIRGLVQIMEDTAVIILYLHEKNISVDMEIPLGISANDLVIALNQIYHLGIDTENILNCYLKAENPIALLKGSKKLGDYGIRNGSVIHIG